LYAGEKLRMWSFVLSWQFSGEWPIPFQARAVALNGSFALGDGHIKLKVRGPLSQSKAY